MKIIICDIDGTLALKGDRDPYDASRAIHDRPNFPVCNLVVFLLTFNYSKIIFVSGRFERDRDVTIEWLARIGVKNPTLFLRADGDNRKDSIVKREIYEQKIAPKFRVNFVLDDRDQCVKMWRELGLTCLQVADGNF